MTSLNKKHKAKNSYMMNGGERNPNKLKRINYYKKRDRYKASDRNKDLKKEF